MNSGKIIIYFGVKKENIGFVLGDMADTIEMEVDDVNGVVSAIINTTQWVTINTAQGKKHINTKNILWFESIPDKEE